MAEAQLLFQTQRLHLEQSFPGPGNAQIDSSACLSEPRTSLPNQIAAQYNTEFKQALSFRFQYRLLGKRAPRGIGEFHLQYIQRKRLLVS